MHPKVSIAIAYQNRLPLLLFALKTINLFSHEEDIEVIVIDYESKEEQKASQLKEMFGFPIRVIEIQQEGWLSPCIPLNIAIREASGEIVMIQNPECFHCGNIVKHAIEYLNDQNYLTYSCYSVNTAILSQITKAVEKDFGGSFGEVQKILLEEQKLHPVISYYVGWYNHPVHRPFGYHFCSVITKKNIDELGGFDERYGPGFGYDDNELLVRIKRKGLQVVVVPPEAGVYAVHQMHQIIHASRGGSNEWRRNRDLYHNVTLKETGWKANG